MVEKKKDENPAPSLVRALSNIKTGVSAKMAKVLSPQIFEKGSDEHQFEYQHIFNDDLREKDAMKQKRHASMLFHRNLVKQLKPEILDLHILEVQLLSG